MEIAHSEAAVYGKPIDEVHFHEVEATDSIVGIAGAAIYYHKLGIGRVLARSIELGRGVVKCARDTMQVPTRLLLKY